jgi:tetratricopeptide (TPR) repeat protein
MTQMCDDDKMAELVTAIQADEDQVERIDKLLGDFPEDARLHFLRGSILIGKGRLIEAHRALSRAVTLAPEFDIARFQLGLFQLTSGEADSALETWGRLDRLPDGHYLRTFVDGLRCLIRDDFAGAIDKLSQGIALNQENPPLNRDMQMLIDQCRPLLNGAAASPAGDNAEAASETSLILQQFANRKNLH